MQDPLRFGNGFTALPLALSALALAACSSPTNGSAAQATHARAAEAVQVAAPAPAAITPLPLSLHPYARPERDLGRMSPDVKLTRLSLLFDRSPAQKKRLAKDLVAIQDPASPSYHRWLTPTEFGARYGAAPADVARARAWLVSQGFRILGLSPSASNLAFTGTVGQVEHAFLTEMHRYQVGGKGHFALSRAPSVPADLGTFVAGLHGAHDFRVPPPAPVGTRHPQASFAGAYALGPADWATIYDVNPLYTAGITGKGQTIAIVGESYYNPDDIVAFRTTFGLDVSNVPMDVLVPNTGNSAVLDPGDVSESELDIEWSGGLAKDAQVLFVYTGDGNSDGFFDAMAYAIEQRVAPIVSVSYGTCEAGLTPSDAIYYGEQGDLAAMSGVTVLVAAGDTGAAGCDNQQEASASEGLFVGFPASIPTITAVGGTQFSFKASADSTYWSTTSAALQYIPEVAWNQTFATGSDGIGAGGGGYSVIFPRPYWQAAALPNSAFRGVPDLSFSAAVNPVPYLISESWTDADNAAGETQTPFAETLVQIGGTSASTPSFAGVVALLNQSLATVTPAATPGVGNIGPELYALYASVPAAFHDITLSPANTIGNSVPCKVGTIDCPVGGPGEYGYPTTVGYDLATGLGSLDVAKFVDAWTALAPTSTTLAVQGSGAVEGTNLTLTATVASSATAHAVTGKVTFYFQTPGTSGGPDLAYVLGEVPVTANLVDAGSQGATATLSAPAPVGLTGASQIVAFYGGDSDYLASYSTAASVTATATFTVTPTSITLQPHQQTTFTTTGGVPPVTWHVTSDGACNYNGKNCSETKALTPTTGGFQAGGLPGTVKLVGLDSDYAEVRVTITVSGNPVDGGMLIPVDAGFDAGMDAGQPVKVPDAGVDATLPTDGSASQDGATDGSPDGASSGSGSSSGHASDSGVGAEDGSKSDGGESPGSSGGCAVAPRGEGPDLGMLGGLFLAFAPLVSRSRMRAAQKRSRA